MYGEKRKARLFDLQQWIYASGEACLLYRQRGGKHKAEDATDGTVVQRYIRYHLNLSGRQLRNLHIIVQAQKLEYAGIRRAISIS